jgi:hypothetical protein
LFESNVLSFEVGVFLLELFDADLMLGLLYQVDLLVLFVLLFPALKFSDFIFKVRDGVVLVPDLLLEVDYLLV